MTPPNITKGDWSADVNERLVFAGSIVIAEVIHESPQVYITPEESEANAKFIAAAPAMAFALNRCVALLKEMQEEQMTHGISRPITKDCDAIYYGVQSLTSAGYTP
jgi:hypothetical protein